MLMNKSVLFIFVILLIFGSSLTVVQSLVPLVVEGQTVNNNISNNKNSLNVKDLINSNILNEGIQLQNKTVSYFDNTFGYLVYPTRSSTDNDNNSKSSSSNQGFKFLELGLWLFIHY
jgi:hypothetical protein